MKNQLIVLGCMILASCGKESGPATGAWLASTNGLECALRLPASRVATGSEVAILAVFRNRSNASRNLPANPYYTVSMRHDGKPFGDANGNAKITEDESVLAPGVEKEFRLTGLRTDINGPGVYTLSGGIGGMELAEVEVTVR